MVLSLTSCVTLESNLTSLSLSLINKQNSYKDMTHRISLAMKSG